MMTKLSYSPVIAVVPKYNPDTFASDINNAIAVLGLANSNLERVAARMRLAPQDVNAGLQDCCEARDFEAYIEPFKLVLARREIEAGYSLVEVAKRVGFADTEALNDVFSRHTGVSAEVFHQVIAYDRAAYEALYFMDPEA